jgi:hypothetical protein
MKNTVLMPLVFVGHFALWLGIIGVFSLFVSGPVITLLLEHNYSAFFIVFLQAILRYSPLACMIAFVNLLLYIMRHPTIWIVTFSLVCAIATISVLVLIPGLYRVRDGLVLNFETAETGISLAESRVYSPGIIRTGPEMLKKVWFHASASGESVHPVILANTMVNPGMRVMTIYDSARYSQKTKGLYTGDVEILALAGGVDPLRAQVEPPALINTIYGVIDPVLDRLHQAYRVGRLQFMMMGGSFYALLTALWCLCYFTSWKLLNALGVLFAFFGCFLVYPLTTRGDWYDFVLRLPGLGPDMVFPLTYTTIAILIPLICLPAYLIRHLRGGRGGSRG